MALVELDRGGKVARKSFSTKAESSEPTFLYPSLAAKSLAENYLVRRPYEVARAELLNPEDAYVKGKLDAMAMVLTMIGQSHLLPNPLLTKFSIQNPPMKEIIPLTSGQVNKLIGSYREARKYLTENKFGSKPISKISPEEAHAWGLVVELGKSLANLGQKEVLEKIDDKTNNRPQVSSNGEVQ